MQYISFFLMSKQLAQVYCLHTWTHISYWLLEHRVCAKSTKIYQARNSKTSYRHNRLSPIADLYSTSDAHQAAMSLQKAVCWMMCIYHNIQQGRVTTLQIYCQNSRQDISASLFWWMVTTVCSSSDFLWQLSMSHGLTTAWWWCDNCNARCFSLTFNQQAGAIVQKYCCW